jgi:electron transport complex protein RnfB
MGEDVYVRLREFLDGMPGGFPATESGVEIKILQRYFTPQEAEVTLQLKPLPEPVGAIAARLGMEEGAAGEMLEAMAKRGNIYRVRVQGQPYYMAMQFLVGIYEFHLKAMDRELAELLHEYFPHLSALWGTYPTKQQRIVPVNSAVDATPAVATYDQIREMVRGQKVIAVADCICRKEHALLDQPCEHPLENCFTFGVAASYYIENGIGREISLEECLQILERAEADAMVLGPTNSQSIMNICCCCKCGCNMIKGLSLYERPADHANSSYRAAIDAESCSACGVCLERCQIDAIVEGDEYMEIDEARCIGCGLCVGTCPEEAVSLVAKAEAVEPPANFMMTQMKIMAERGLT